MSITTAQSTEADLAAACAEVCAKLAPSQPQAVVYFASPRHDPAALAAALREGLPEAKLVGCTTAGELCGDQMLEGSLVAMSLRSATINYWRSSR